MEIEAGAQSDSDNWVGTGDALAAIQDQMQLVHAAAARTDGVLVLTVIYPATNNRPEQIRPQHFNVGDVERMVSEASARGQIANVYLGLHVMRRDLSSGSRGKAEDIIAVFGMALDDDGDTNKRATLPSIEPSIELTTCTLPTINRHLIFLFSRALSPADAKILAELLHRKCGGDHGAKDIAHIWRLAQTKNFPNKAKLKRGRPEEPQAVEATGGSYELIKPEEFRRVLESMPDRHPQMQKSANGQANGSGQHAGGSTDREAIMDSLPLWVMKLVNTEIVEGEGDRSAHCFHTMMGLMECGLTDDEIRVVAEGAPFAAKYLARGDIDAEISRSRAKWTGEARRARVHAAVPPSQPRTDTVIDGGALLDRVHEFIGRFVAYPSKHDQVGHTLWIAHTWLMDAWESTPRLAFLSPEPASGKTRALEVTELLVPNPVEAVNVTPAYLFRKVAAPEGRPTILYDEIDTVFGPKAKDNEEIRGLLNAGHRKGAVAGRCVMRGKIVETEEIPAYCAVAMAGLGNLPDTILTRAMVSRMRRRAPHEEILPFRRRLHAETGEQIRAQLAAWAASVKDTLIDAWPDMPLGIHDRDADVWEAPLAIADVIGGEWPKRARDAAVALVTLSKESTPSLGVRLLSDLRTFFAEAGAEGMWTETILKKLHALVEAPWGDIKGKPLSDRGLAKLLKPYGARPKVVRIGDDVNRGYAREDLHDAWIRYLPPIPAKGVTDVTDATSPEGRAS